MAPISISLLAGDGLPDSRPESCSALLGLPREFPVEDAPPGTDEGDNDVGFTLTTDDDDDGEVDVVFVIHRSVLFVFPAAIVALFHEVASLALGMVAICCRSLLLVASAPSTPPTSSLPPPPPPLPASPC